MPTTGNHHCLSFHRNGRRILNLTDLGIKVRITTVQSPFAVAGYIYKSSRDRDVLPEQQVLQS